MERFTKKSDHSIYTDYDSYTGVYKDKVNLEVKEEKFDQRQSMEYYYTFVNALINLHIFDLRFVGKYKDDNEGKICLCPFQ